MANVFNKVKTEIANADFDLGVATIDMLLLTTTPTTLTGAQYDFDFVDDVLLDAGFVEPTGEGTYTTTTDGRRNVANIAPVEDSGADVADVGFTPDGQGGISTWDAIDTVLIDGCLIYERSTALGSADDATAQPICSSELVSPAQANGGNLTLTFPGDVYMTLGN